MTPSDVIDSLNAAWQKNAPGTIANAVRGLFTDDVVFVGPNLARVAQGADAAARSYDDFRASAAILALEIGDSQIDEFGTVAVALEPWSMTYEFQGTTSSETGYDLYVLRRDGDDWKICWRQMVSYPSSAKDRNS